ncbi:MAG: hypothetical protein WCF84_02780 [Anaerolineae bacterium]
MQLPMDGHVLRRLILTGLNTKRYNISTNTIWSKATQQLSPRREESSMFPTTPDHLAGTHVAVPAPGQTLTGQNPLAYHTVAWIVLVSAVLMLLDGFLLDQNILFLLVRSAIDFALALALLKLWPSARALMLLRVVLGGLLSICAYQNYSINFAILVGMILPTVGYCLSIFILLVGRTTTRRLIAAVAIYIVLSLAPMG